METDSNSALLDGVRVLDLSQYIPGPFATRQLADLGANVIKIEPPSGDPMRWFMFQDDESVSPIYRHINRGKRISRLNLKSDQAKKVLTNLLADADVLLESYRPGVLERLGFSRGRLKQINPRLIHCALSGYGQTGPYKTRAGHDVNYLAGSGILALSGTEERPVMTYPPLADHAGAIQASTAILAALYAREKNQQAAFLDISLFESALAWNYLSILNNTKLRAADILNGGAACYNIYQCADGAFVSLGAIEAHFWQRFCTAVDQLDWINRQQEKMPQQNLIKQVNHLFSSQPVGYWNRILADTDCCYEPVLLLSELNQHPQIQAREMINTSGPAYPGKINDSAVDINEHFTETNVAIPLHW